MNRDLLKAYTIFALFTGVGFAIVLADWSSGYFLDPINCFTASASGWIINLLGGQSTVTQTHISSPYGGVSIAEGCNSVYVTILFLAGVFAFPTSWRKKWLGALLGTVALFVINLVRVATLFYLSGSNTWLFQEAHLHIWQFAIILIGGLLWLLWYDKIVKEPKNAKGL
ncbi:MAG: exosortase H [candidate division Zixibacteria bacterium]|nr:exosortase H [candidate division Zixibacteria bacterium]